MLTAEQIAERIAERASTTATYRHIEPLAAVAARASEGLLLPDGIGLGLPDIDVRTRGFRANDLVLITGFSHSGKTQLVNTMILNNPQKRILFISIDDPAEMILIKLLAMRAGTSAEEIERLARNGDIDITQMFTTFAEEYPNLIVVDKRLDIKRMNEAVDEAKHQWGTNPDAVVIDYLELIPAGTITGESELTGVKAKATELQTWAKRNPWPTIVLHQGTRSNARPGEPITIMSLAYGGEQQASIIIGVRRKRDRADLEPDDRAFHQDTVTLHIVKNKRPGGKLTNYDGIDFWMEPDTGRIRQIGTADRRQASVVTTVERVRELAGPPRQRPDYQTEAF